jgi:hypothetical protein
MRTKKWFLIMRSNTQRIKNKTVVCSISWICRKSYLRSRDGKNDWKFLFMDSIIFEERGEGLLFHGKS